MEHSVALLRGNMNNKFTVEICSDLDYEEMVADISFENKRIAMITQENGVDKMEIEIFGGSSLNYLAFPLDEFIKTIEFAKNKLIKMSKRIDE